MEDPDREKREKKNENEREKEEREKRTKQRGCIQKIDTHKNGLVVAPSAIQNTPSKIRLILSFFVSRCPDVHIHRI